MGRMAAFRGLVGFPALYIGGLLYEHLVFRVPLLANKVGLFVALVKEPQHEEIDS